MTNYTWALPGNHYLYSIVIKCLLPFPWSDRGFMRGLLNNNNNFGNFFPKYVNSFLWTFKFRITISWNTQILNIIFPSLNPSILFQSNGFYFYEISHIIKYRVLISFVHSFISRGWGSHDTRCVGATNKTYVLTDPVSLRGVTTVTHVCVKLYALSLTLYQQ